jgi:hypothetical protein
VLRRSFAVLSVAGETAVLEDRPHVAGERRRRRDTTRGLRRRASAARAGRSQNGGLRGAAARARREGCCGDKSRSERTGVHQAFRKGRSSARARPCSSFTAR